MHAQVNWGLQNVGERFFSIIILFNPPLMVEHGHSLGSPRVLPIPPSSMVSIGRNATGQSPQDGESWWNGGRRLLRYWAAGRMPQGSRRRKQSDLVTGSSGMT